MSRPIRLVLVAVAGILLLIAAAFGLSRALGGGEILAGVNAGPVDLGGMTPEQAAERLRSHEAELLATPVELSVEDEIVQLDPARVGFRLDVDPIVARAMAEGRQGRISQQFRWWLGHVFGDERVPLEGSIDAVATGEVLRRWSVDHVGDPPFPGAVDVEGTEPVAVYPRSGRQIDPDQAPGLILDTILGRLEPPTPLPIITEQPRLTAEDVDRAVARARLWLSAPITLVSDAGDVSITFSVEDLATALRSEAGNPGLTLSFDPGAVGRVLEGSRESLETPPVDARFVIDGYQVSVAPGRSGTRIDPDATAEALSAAAVSTSRQGSLPLREGADPDVTTEQLEALDVRHLVSSFTTYHDCCQNRVTNIHLIADAVDGVIVRPGDSFGVNAFVGERTETKGYLPDGTIIRGEFVETVGGGVSQFATTFYNAIFWGGYEDVTHKPHSYYISRYPEGIEATISYPLPELEFRNDSDAAVLIKTEYTDTSITVQFYGNNDGRIVVGAHRRGNTDVDLVAEGGPAARRVSADVSGRSDFTEPTTEYRPNPALDPEDQKQLQSPAQGWTVTVTRVIEENGASRSQEWTVRYLAQREIVEVHPCRMPGAGQACPTTTTTTIAPTTTTAPPGTTTVPPAP